MSPSPARYRCILSSSPLIAKFEVVRRGDARRSKLYYLRDRVGKRRRRRERRRGMKHVEGQKTIQ